jgi:acetyltransferase-like isoleucine patch superfamily enzyme
MSRQGLMAALRRARGGMELLLTHFIGFLPTHTLRRMLYRAALGVSLDRGAHVYRRVEVRGGKHVRVGARSSIGHDVILDGRGGLQIGADVNVSSQAAIWTMEHDPESPTFGVREAPVEIRDRSWLAFRCTILPGVTVGEGAVVGAGAVVTKDVDPYTIVAGSPARPIGVRRTDLSYELEPPLPLV